jgi:hypothetical protein
LFGKGNRYFEKLLIILAFGCAVAIDETYSGIFHSLLKTRERFIGIAQATIFLLFFVKNAL